jgi:hypothetical protein
MLVMIQGVGGGGEYYGLKGGMWVADIGSLIIFTVCKALLKKGCEWTRRIVCMIEEMLTEF